MALDRIHRAILARGPATAPDPEVQRRASVALVLQADPSHTWPNMLMIRRSEQKGDPWSGHMAFPGGRAEEEDPDLLSTAMRESREELDLDLSGARVLGALHAMHTPTIRTLPMMAVQPWVFGVSEVPALRPNVEVASVHWFNVQRFLDREGRDTFTYEWRGQPLDLPCVRLDGCFIWGLSLRIIDDLIERVEQHAE